MVSQRELGHLHSRWLTRGRDAVLEVSSSTDVISKGVHTVYDCAYKTMNNTKEMTSGKISTRQPCKSHHYMEMPNHSWGRCIKMVKSGSLFPWRPSGCTSTLIGRHVSLHEELGGLGSGSSSVTNWLRLCCFKFLIINTVKQLHTLNESRLRNSVFRTFEDIKITL